ncbi:hypothetical protein BKA65DRAFT_543283 [Rhexocercosporidium sp. MPI-PUGE-AT-0058]|nr:hypothetical protein BKA65DRAFT_543283 [Rhexocercosporidium sp. MPI-PUGE-AT-0058]
MSPSPYLVVCLLFGLPLTSPSISSQYSPAVANNASTEKLQEVGWQSIFWALLSLALLAMTQPSILDQGLSPSNLLFPARVSPLVCLTDGIEVIVHLAYELLHSTPLRNAAFKIGVKRQQDRRIATMHLERSIIRQHPKASVVLFLGPLSQAIKLFGFHGLLWAKILAGIYLISYMILAGVLALAQDGDGVEQSPTVHPVSEDSTLPTATIHSTSKVTFCLGFTSLTASLLCCSWAVFQVCNSGEGNYELADVLFSFQPSILAYFLYACLVVGVYIRLCSFLVSYFCIMVSLGICLEALNRVLGKYCNWSRLKVAFGASLFFLGVATGIYLMYTSFLWWFNYKGWLTDGSGVLVVGTGLAWFVAIIFDLFGCLKSFHSRELTMEISFYLVLSFVAHLVVALLYFSNVYDSEGTVKPGWTEKLG